MDYVYNNEMEEFLISTFLIKVNKSTFSAFLLKCAIKTVYMLILSLRINGDWGYTKLCWQYNTILSTFLFPKNIWILKEECHPKLPW